MKYVIVIPTLTVGGAEKIALETAIGIHEKGHQVDIIVLSNRIELSVPSYIKIKTITKYKLFNILKYLRKEKVNGCISYMERANLYAAICCKITKTKYCASVHTAPKSGFSQRKLINKFFINLIYKLIKTLNSRVICVCEGIKKDLNLLYGINNSVVIPNFINQQEIATKANAGDLVNKYFDFIFVGRLSKVKGCDVFIDAILASHDIIIRNKVSIAILGGGPERVFLEQKIENANLSKYVLFLGTLINPYNHMRHSKFLVVPSYAEGFGLVVLEALSLGCNVIYSNCDFGPREIISRDFPEMTEFNIFDPSINRELAVDDLKKNMLNIIHNGVCLPISHEEIHRRIEDNYNRALVCEAIINSLEY
ncbi:glycosyltransferase [Enterobacteriaceae bacterium H16N7]|nr:glycosyltransferase [Dryocola clanedunensis]